MANYSLNDVSLFPSNNILKTDSKITTEENVARLLKSLGIKNHVISGLTASVAGTTLTVSSGSAFINGYVIVSDSSVDLTFDPAETYYLYMYIRYDINGHIIGPDVSDNVQGIVVDIITDNSTSNLLNLVKTIEDGQEFQGTLDDFLLIGTLTAGVYAPDQFNNISIDGGSF